MILASILVVLLTIMAIACLVLIRSLVARTLMLILYIAAISIVLSPSLSTTIAHWFGIGRGVDFILILATVALTNGLIFFTRFLFTMQRNITKMARHIAIREAIYPHAKSN